MPCFADIELTREENTTIHQPNLPHETSVSPTNGCSQLIKRKRENSSNNENDTMAYVTSRMRKARLSPVPEVNTDIGVGNGLDPIINRTQYSTSFVSDELRAQTSFKADAVVKEASLAGGRMKSVLLDAARNMSITRNEAALAGESATEACRIFRSAQQATACQRADAHQTEAVAANMYELHAERKAEEQCASWRQACASSRACFGVGGEAGTAGNGQFPAQGDGLEGEEGDDEAMFYDADSEGALAWELAQRLVISTGGSSTQAMSDEHRAWLAAAEASRAASHELERAEAAARASSACLKAMESFEADCRQRWEDAAKVAAILGNAAALAEDNAAYLVDHARAVRASKTSSRAKGSRRTTKKASRGRRNSSRMQSLWAVCDAMDDLASFRVSEGG